MKVKKSKAGEIDYILFYTIFLLVAIGVVMVYSASSYTALVNQASHDSTLFLKKQALCALIGALIMFFAIKIDYHIFRKWCGWIMLATFACLILVLIVGVEVKGAKRWIRIAGQQFQPSELAKYAIVIFLAVVIEKNINKISEPKFVIFRLLLISGLFSGLVLMEKNLSIASVILMVTLIILYVAGIPKKFFYTLLGCGAIFGGLGIALESYRLKRFLTFLHPFQDPSGDGYQLIQSFYALGAGGITGLGLGQSRQKTLYMPEPHNDFIFSIIGEELGLIGCIILIILFIVLIYRGILISMKAKDTLGSLVAIGITSVIAIQAIINIAVVTGSMPVTGVPLPFISYGGTSLIVNMGAMGVLLNISRQTK
ncbi:MAG: putative lipid II flippase FtsW [Inconstantimicrobium porci]|uniref:Probable peptidoglycan glycosyltransferase FtsW n=1 Tax=Inconstantimicrobium porci TaxID=2652291 RepID=A0A7X2MVV8_9CLOT|nr:putative lipid II flippase FtsW [Inconstantimicrobium porci]MDD6771917.1 putative lipid II flippase FtsW [Inconstantimicrobium porci]MDY5913602.1 putative lipid II flippase FtsW [Inconstantimicrobium porci]MSR90009.1 putative lipid II flippase FtsW [Inconstantimicrobium porci]